MLWTNWLTQSPRRSVARTWNSADYQRIQRTERLETRCLLAAISGTSFFDANLNGAFDKGDTWLSGQTIFVDRNGNGQLDSQFNSNAHIPIPDLGTGMK